MILEDAHWADPTSLELFSGAVDRTPPRRVLLIITFRPEFGPPWIGQSHVTFLTLNRLTRGEVEGLIDRLAGNTPLAANVRRDIIERTDGIPLFVEEMTKAVLGSREPEGGRTDGSGHSVCCGCGPSDFARLANGTARPARRSR
jgi:predicted ATPase